MTIIKPKPKRRTKKELEAWIAQLETLCDEAGVEYIAKPLAQMELVELRECETKEELLNQIKFCG